MTLSLEPTCQLPPAGNGQGDLRPVAVVFGRWKEAIFADFGIFVKKPAFFVKKPFYLSVETPKSAIFLQRSVINLQRSAMFLIRSVTLLIRLMTFLIRSVTNLQRSVTFLIRSVTFLIRLVTFLTRLEALLKRLMTNLQRLAMFLIRSVTFLIRLVTNLIRSVTDLTGLKPDIGDKMAQIVVLKADLITDKAPGTPGTNFISKFVGAEVTRLKAKEVRDSLRRLLHALINFNVSILINGIQGVAYASNNVSASCRSLRSGG